MKPIRRPPPLQNHRTLLSSALYPFVFGICKFRLCPANECLVLCEEAISKRFALSHRGTADAVGVVCFGVYNGRRSAVNHKDIVTRVMRFVEIGQSDSMGERKSLEKRDFCNNKNYISVIASVENNKNDGKS
uniref:PPM-type phosphatase domain-containing protein n=1 Tax=Steinernema glaseri TaxID=37863 RepID=A0A1I7ZPG4_9BILA